LLLGAAARRDEPHARQKVLNELHRFLRGMVVLRFILPRQSRLRHFCGFAPPGGPVLLDMPLQAAGKALMQAQTIPLSPYGDFPKGSLIFQWR